MTSMFDPLVAHPVGPACVGVGEAKSITHVLCDCNDARSCVFVGLAPVNGMSGLPPRSAGVSNPVTRSNPVESMPCPVSSKTQTDSRGRVPAIHLDGQDGTRMEPMEPGHDSRAAGPEAAGITRWN
jgi:hypothetical protein